MRICQCHCDYCKYRRIGKRSLGLHITRAVNFDETCVQRIGIRILQAYFIKIYQHFVNSMQCIHLCMYAKVNINKRKIDMIIICRMRNEVRPLSQTNYYYLCFDFVNINPQWKSTVDSAQCTTAHCIRHV